MKDDVFSKISKKQLSFLSHVMKEMTFEQFSNLPQSIPLESYMKFFKKMITNLTGTQAASLSDEIIPLLKGANAKFFKELGKNYTAKEVIKYPDLVSKGLISKSNLNKLLDLNENPLPEENVLSIVEKTGLTTKSQFDQINGICGEITSKVLQKTDPELFKYFSNKCISILPNETVSSINKNQFQFISNRSLRGFNSRQISYMKDDVFSNISKKQLSFLTNVMEGMTFEQFSNLAQSISLGSYIKFFENMINNLTGTQAASLSDEIIPLLKGANAKFFKELGKNYTAKEVIKYPDLVSKGLISKNKLSKLFDLSFASKLDTGDFASIPIEIFEGLGSGLKHFKGPIQNLSHKDFKSLPLKHAELILENISILKLDGKLLKWVSDLPRPKTLGQIPFWAIKYIRPVLFSDATTKHIEQLNWRSNLTKEQVEQIPAKAFRAFTPEMIKYNSYPMNSKQLSYLSSSALSNLSILALPYNTLANLTSDQISALPAGGFKEFYSIMEVNVDALKGLTTAQVSNLRCIDSLIRLYHENSNYLTKEVRKFVRSKISSSSMCEHEFWRVKPYY